MAELTIRGLQRLQARNVRRMAALRPDGATGEAVRDATVLAHRYAVAITHVDTGSWRASHRMAAGGLRGVVFVSRGAKNYKTGGRVLEYASHYEAAGGRMAVYTRTAREAGPRILRQVGRRLLVEVAEP